MTERATQLNFNYLQENCRSITNATTQLRLGFFILNIHRSHAAAIPCIWSTLNDRYHCKRSCF
ncbi:TPA: hypothetical protein G9F29_002243 [Salmonella enterica]|uniref:Uncharacterized protein n=1 Tax=Salmonella enterica TaxID=28901 RepID=A0A747TQ54_SALER|nr:hypothetical protein [Salmonella enterica]